MSIDEIAETLDKLSFELVPYGEAASDALAALSMAVKAGSVDNWEKGWLKEVNL